MNVIWESPDGGNIVSIEASESPDAGMLMVGTDRGNIYIIDAALIDWE